MVWLWHRPVEAMPSERSDQLLAGDVGLGLCMRGQRAEPSVISDSSPRTGGLGIGS